jgi:predicted polyphosphate/ATP-dependent NAD kinase
MFINRKSVGVIINPIAGLGGRVGLKGSDGEDIVEKAIAMGAEPEASIRAGYALMQLIDIKDDIDMCTYGGEMGENQLKALDFSVRVVGTPLRKPTTAQDTIDAARLLNEAGVVLILFAGGDGTARNIYEAIGDSVPVIGIPAGVKIHSAVYATSARNAGLAAKDYLEGLTTEVKMSEVMDIDEEMFRQGRISAKLYGYMKVPESDRMQNMKSGGVSETEELLGVAGHIISKMQSDTLYIVGPGTTTKGIMDGLELPNTLLGVDVVKNRKLIASDVSESQLWEMVNNEEKVKILVTIIGGQGNLFGRGNQQISPRIIRKVGKNNIIVAATASKLISLYNEPLLVDTGDPELDEELCGYIEIVKGFAHTSIYPVSN